MTAMLDMTIPQWGGDWKFLLSSGSEGTTARDHGYKGYWAAPSRQSGFPAQSKFTFQCHRLVTASGVVPL